MSNYDNSDKVVELKPVAGVESTRANATRRQQRKARRRAQAIAAAEKVSDLPSPANSEAVNEALQSFLLPQRVSKRSFAQLLSFALVVILPVVAAASYFIFIASSQFAAGFSFSVRDSRTAASSSAGLGIEVGLGTTASPNTPENYMVVDYLTSRQAVEDLHRRIDLRGMFSRTDIDWLSRFDATSSTERLVHYWKSMISASFDPITGVAAAQVRAFAPDDAYAIATALVELSEEVINATANRPLRDAVRFAEEDVSRAEARLRNIRHDLLSLRNNELVIDPQQSVVATNVLLAQNLRTSLAQIQTELAALKKQNLPDNALVPTQLQMRFRATKEQLEKVEKEVAGMRDGSNPLSHVVAQFELLELDRQFAQNTLLATMQNLDKARSRLVAQHVYVTPFVRPALPTSSTYPNRPVEILLVTLACLLIWFVGQLVVRSIREHHI